MNEIKTLPAQIRLTADLGSRRPNSIISAAPASGNSGISQRCVRKYSLDITPRKPLSPLQHIHFIRQDGLTIPEECNDDTEPHRGLRRRIGNNEKREDLPINRAKQPRKCDEIDIHGV